jgi:diguanylate cyclase (GGDEF)-like protein/PAS domain S-box-containing protein
LRILVIMPPSIPLLACLLAVLCLGALATWLVLRAQAQHRRASAAAEDSARRSWNRSLADAAFDGLLIHRAGLILQMNRALSRLLGVREREVLNQNFANFARPDQLTALRAELEAPHPNIAEFTLIRANKTDVTVEISSQTIDFDGQPATVTAIRDISQRLADAKRIHQLTHYDALTGLPTRKLFADTIAAAITAGARQQGLTIFTIDLDQFKAMNLQLGRNGGDHLLRQVAARIRGLAAPEDTLARLGGDKFGLAVTAEGGANRALSLAGRLAAAFAEPFIVDGQLVKPTLSIGIAVYPDHAADADSLMKASEFALGLAERAGGGVAHMYCHHEAAGQPRLAAPFYAPPAISPDSVRAAIAAGEIGLFYQPVLNTADLRPAGLAALPRWQHPRDGLLPPERFMPVAEAAGLSHELGMMLLERACAEAVAANAPILSIAISPTHFRDVNLPAHIASILRKTGLPARALELDVTEAMLTENRPRAEAALAGLHALGLGVALDHFGAGQVNLPSLCDLPLKRLKIARRFIAKLGEDAHAAAIITAILTLAANLRLPVTATGVETQAQLDVLRSLGCPSVQGNFFGEPALRAVTAQIVPLIRPNLAVTR